MNLENKDNNITDERIRKISWYKALLTRPESGALLGVIFVDFISLEVESKSSVIESG